MKSVARSVVALAFFGSVALGVAALLSTPVRAVDNPCDPTYAMLSNCRAQHGRWDNSCCCCRTH